MLQDYFEFISVPPAPFKFVPPKKPIFVKKKVKEEVSWVP
jgi:hypothetical protein